jgi:haloalkane dehalogenase
LLAGSENGKLRGMCPLPDYPFESHFQEVSGYRLHYIDAGAKDAPTILFLHGVPTWSYTFRKIIPLCTEAGYRVVAPDLPGFGLSQKEIPTEIFSLEWLTKMIAGFMEKCNISKPVLFAHDWGGVIGLMLASSNEAAFSGIILCNSLLPLPGMRIPLLFKLWRCFARYSPVLPVATIVDVASKRKLNRAERRGYAHPFRSVRDKKAIRIMPRLLPFKDGQKGYAEVVKAWSLLSGYRRAVLTLFSQGDPITRRGEHIIRERIPGARNRAHKILKGGHFIQEDAPGEIANSIIAFMRSET